jgi:hypothetical protein
VKSNGNYIGVPSQKHFKLSKEEVVDATHSVGIVRIRPAKSAFLQRLIAHCWRVSRYLGVTLRPQD